jgi:formylglycine-generating enzyme required for sulfatase activity
MKNRGKVRLFRGGGCSNGAADSRVTRRYISGPGDRRPNVGFRLVLP